MSATLVAPVTIPIRLTVNGRPRTVGVEPHHTLLEVLRDDLELTGTKECCLVGECGACTVSLDGRIVDSCLVLAVEADGGEVTTVEGLAIDGTLSALQAAFLDKGAVQCGFCIPGQLIAAADLLRRVPDPTLDEVEEGLAGNLCRCGCYEQITEAVFAVAGSRSIETGRVDPAPDGRRAPSWRSREARQPEAHERSAGPDLEAGR